MTSSPLLFLLLLASATAFSPQSTPFTTGKAKSVVCSRDELSRDQRCSPLTIRSRDRSMPPFLQQLGSKKSDGVMEISSAMDDDDDEICVVEEEELSETKKLLKQVKEAGTAGVISYALWELGFWALSVPVCVFGYYEVTGHLPDLTNKEDTAKLGAEAFAFVNFARFAVPLRIGLALGTTPWIQENVVDRFLKKDEEVICVPEVDGGDDA